MGMYNRYIPESTQYTWVGEDSQPAPPPRAAASTGHRPGGEPRRPAPSKALPFQMGGEKLAALLSGKTGGGLAGLLKGLKLEDIDPGDVLLLLIILYLLIEGDDLELVIALGLVLLMGLGGGDKQGDGPEGGLEEGGRRPV